MDADRFDTIVDLVDPWFWAVLGAGLILILLIGVAIGWASANRRRNRQVSERYGPEYDRVRSDTGSAAATEAELSRREARVQQFDIRPLTREEHERYSEAWRQIQTHFVDNPSEATADADRLVVQVMETRGYPVADFEQRAEDLSVDHPRVVENYRSARAIADRNDRGEADTEELRQALVHYRALFEDLLEPGEPRETETQRTVEAR